MDIANITPDQAREIISGADASAEKRLEAFFDDIRDLLTPEALGVFKGRIREYYRDLHFGAEDAALLRDGDKLAIAQEKNQHFRNIRTLLNNGAQIRFFYKGHIGGVNISKIEFREGRELEVWNNPPAWLSIKLGFDDLARIVTDTAPGAPEYPRLRDAILDELNAGWVEGGEGRLTNATLINKFAHGCRGLNDYLCEMLPTITGERRAQMILQLFLLDDYIEPAKFAQIIKQ